MTARDGRPTTAVLKSQRLCYDGLFESGGLRMWLFWRFLYPPIYTLLLALYVPWQWLRRGRGGRRVAPWRRRAGAIPETLRHRVGDLRPRLWIHAVSVGEINVIKPLVDRLDLPASQLFVSTITTTGQDLARRLYGERATVFYFPLDWRFSCRRYLDAIRPDAVVLTEAELWPGFIGAARGRNVRLILVNGRLSDRSFRRYLRIKPLLKPLLHAFERLCMQSREDKQRMLELGAPEDRVNLMGNLKYDYQLADDLEKRQLVARLEHLLKPQAGDLLWICGSTREGEEALLLPVFARLRERFPQLRLLLAPRHPNRGAEVATLARAAGCACRQRSVDFPTENSSPAPDVYVLDSIGELPYLYQIADVVFVGGSLIPWGGHNIIEAAHFSQPILFGPHVHNFREITQAFLERYAALQVKDTSELADRLTGLLEDAAARQWLGRNARKVIRDNQGAVERTAEVIAETLHSGGGNRTED